VKGGGSFWPVRDYHWGTCEAFSTQHSDCTYLKKLLLEEAFHDVRRKTEERYLAFRCDYYAQRAEAEQTSRRLREAKAERARQMQRVAEAEQARQKQLQAEAKQAEPARIAEEKRVMVLRGCVVA
jgi:septin family protein